MLTRTDQVEAGPARRNDLLHAFLYLVGHRFPRQVLSINEESQFHGRSSSGPLMRNVNACVLPQMKGGKRG